MYVFRRSWHNGKKTYTRSPFLKHDAQWQAKCSSNLYFSKILCMSLCPQNGSDSNAQPLFVSWEKVYAAMSSLSGDSGMLVSGNLSCALAPWIIVSFHHFKDWFTISVVDMGCSQSWQNMMPPPMSLHKSLCLARCKQSGSFSLNKLSGIPFSMFFDPFHQCICVWCKIGVHNLYLQHCQHVLKKSV